MYECLCVSVVCVRAHIWSIIVNDEVIKQKESHRFKENKKKTKWNNSTVSWANYNDMATEHEGKFVIYTDRLFVSVVYLHMTHSMKL